MAAKDETTRRLAATVASNTYRAFPERAAERRKAAHVPVALRDEYESEVDPHGALTADVRRRRAVAAWRRDQAQRALDAHTAALRAGGNGPRGHDCVSLGACTCFDGDGGAAA